MKQKRKSSLQIIAIIISFTIFWLWWIPVFAQESCTVLPWFEPSPLPDTEHIDAYSINQATWTETCEDNLWILVCNNGDLVARDAGWIIYPDWAENHFIYPSCVDTDWANCSADWHIVSHNSQLTIYKLAESTFDTMCADTYIDVTCRDWNFYIGGGTELADLDEYQYFSCEERRFVDCVHPWERRFVRNWESIIWYSNIQSNTMEECSDMREELTCWDWNFYNEDQVNLGSTIEDNEYVEECTDLDILSCAIDWTDDGVDDFVYYDNGTSWLTWYIKDFAEYPKTCSNYSLQLECNNWSRRGGNVNEDIYQNCTNSGSAPIYNEDQMLADLSIVWIWLSSHNDLREIGSTPYLIIQIKNESIEDANSNGPVAGGFIACRTEDGMVYNSPELESFYLVADWSFQFPAIPLTGNFVNEIGKVQIECAINLKSQNGNFSLEEHTIQEWVFEWSDEENLTYLYNNKQKYTFEMIAQTNWRFDKSMSSSITLIERNLDSAEVRIGKDAITDFIFGKILNVLIPIMIIIWLLITIIGFYQLMFAEGEDATSKGINYIIRWIVWILVMMSAKYMSTIIFEQIFQTWDIQTFNGIAVAESLYEQLMVPFIKLASYIILGVLFVILLTRVITFLTSDEEDIQKKASTIIIWNIMWMLIIIGAKQIVEAVYWKKIDVLNHSAQNLGEIWSGVLASKNIPILFDILNRVLGFVSLIVLIIIIAQTFQLLTKPDDPEQIKKISKNILYIFIWILIIGSAYLLVNFFVVS